jgi:hypothetical protein
MADKKISELTALTGANVADTDLLPIVDTSATETKKITFGEFKTALDTATGFVRITGDTMTGNLSFGDNNKAIFGAGSDLQIYHDGSNSYISDQGTNDLKILATDLQIKNAADNEFMMTAVTDGAVTLYHNGAAKLATTATGIDVTGTVTADGLTVDGAATVSQNMTNGSSAAFTDPHLALKATNSVDTTGFVGMSFATSDNTNYGFSLGAVRSSGGVGDLVFRNHFNSAQGTKKLNIATNGDISFYEDTGTTAKFFWDASAESLGIGTGSPSLPLQVNSTTSGLPVTSGTTQTNGVFRLSSSATSGIIDFGMNGSNPWIQATDYTGLNNNYNLLLNPNGGNVGIGTVPASIYGKNLHVHTAATTGSSLQLTDGTTGSGVNDGLQIICTNGLSYIWNREATDMVFATSNLERMRIDSSGSWMTGNTVARTASQYSNQGGASWYHPDQHFEISTTSNQAALEVGKNNANDGELIAFRKQGTTVGSIGTYSSRMYIGTGDVGLQFLDAADNILPINPSTPANRDGAIDLGAGAVRFKDLYLSGGVYLGGTGAANKLDDYEEGTWTPAVSGVTTAGTASYSLQIGSYVKIGSLVYASCNIYATGFNGTGDFRVSGLPFTAASDHTSMTAAQWNNSPFATFSDYGGVVGLLSANQTYIEFRASDTNASGTYTQLQCGPTTISYLRLTMTYTTDQ